MSQSELFLSKELDGSLNAFVTSSRPPPEPIATSQEIRDRGSIFVANIYQATSPVQARACVNHLKHVVHRAKKATHEIAAWRCMHLKRGRTGLDGLDDFELVQGSDDDGERWASDKVLKVMKQMSVIDAVVIVSRWYGGTELGPARFAHIELCTEEVCKAYKQHEELRDCIVSLQTLDDLLAEHRQQLAALSPEEDSGTPASTQDGKKVDYKKLDVPKAKRLIKARESSIKSVKAMIAKKSESHPT